MAPGFLQVSVLIRFLTLSQDFTGRLAFMYDLRIHFSMHKKAGKKYNSKLRWIILSISIFSLNIKLQSGGVFNYSEIVVNCAKNNIHLESEDNSFNVGDNNLFYIEANKPSISVEGIRAGIIDGDAAKTILP